jgi:hypothetical protein
MGATIASIIDNSENDFVSRLNPFGSAQRWIGASLVRTATPQTAPFSYTWTDGSAFGYSMFGTGQPDDLAGDEDCLQISQQPSFWSDASCTLVQPSICKRAG